MRDVRQGRLTVANDPLSTAADRVVNMRLPHMTEAELDAFCNPPALPGRVAARGYADRGGLPFWWLDVAVWRDTITGEPWDGVRR